MTAIKEQVGRDAIEHASVDEIRNVQLERLKWTLKHAYDNVPHYRQKFDEAGVHPDDLKQLSDISKFPFTTKQDLRDNYPFKMFAVPREQVARVHASSGTTGKPKGVRRPIAEGDSWIHLADANGLAVGDEVELRNEYQLARANLRAQHFNTTLGQLWLILNPLMLAGVYCVLVDLINLVGTDTNPYDNSAQENIKIVASVTIHATRTRSTRSSVSTRRRATSTGSGVSHKCSRISTSRIRSPAKKAVPPKGKYSS